MGPCLDLTPSFNAKNIFLQLCDQYVERCLELSKNQAVEAQGQRDDQTKRDFMRVKENTVKCSQRVAKAGEDYQKAITAYNQVQSDWIEEMTNACNVWARVAFTGAGFNFF